MSKGRSNLSSLGAACRSRSVLALLLLLALPSFCGAEVGDAKRYLVKAAFLYNMPKFVEWPPQSFAEADAPIVFGILGPNPVGDVLETMAKDRKLNGRNIVVIHVETVEAAKAVQVLFVAARESWRFAAMQPALQHSPVLTVGESQEFIDNGGVIRFVPVDDKLRFEINMTSAEQTGLKVSAQLQKLATNMRKLP